MRRTTTPLAAAAAAALLLAACAEDTDTGDDNDGESADAGGAFPVTVGEVTLEERPERIVSLSPTVTEMLFAVEAGDQVVATDEHSDYPEDAPTTELSGYDFNVESLLEYDPDLVVISSFAQDIVPQLEDVETPVYVAPDSPTSMADVYDQIADLGSLTGHDEAAGDLVKDMSAEVATLTADAPELAEPLTYYLEIDENFWTYTSTSLAASLFSQVGLESIAEDDEMVSIQLSAEAIVDADPDIIFYTNSASGVDADVIADRAGWNEITAVENDRIVALDGDIASRWGPRTVDLLADAVEAVEAVAADQAA